MTSILNNDNSAAQADLDAKLKYFQQPPIQAQVRPNVLMQASAGEENAEVALEEPTDGQESEQPSSDSIEASESKETVEEDPGFIKAFEKHFGVTPDEAVGLFNELQAFRDEMILMRKWGISPAEYDSRMQQVREFYKQLPEEGQAQFNNVEGAIAIWDYISKQNPTTNKQATQAKSATRIKAASTPKQEVLRKSDILRMSQDEYQRNLPKITKAFREGRVVLDV